MTDKKSRTIHWESLDRALEQIPYLDGLSYLTLMRDRKLPVAPIAQLMGFDLDGDLEEGRVVFSGIPDEFHYNPVGLVHGGFALTLLDSAIGCAIHTTLPARAFYSTLETKVNFVRPMSKTTGRVICEGTVIHRGRQTATGEGRIIGEEDGKLYAHGTATCLLSQG